MLARAAACFLVIGALSARGGLQPASVLTLEEARCCPKRPSPGRTFGEQ